MLLRNILLYCPVPARVTDRVVAGAETLILRFAVLVPAGLGLNVTLTVQLAPAAGPASLIGKAVPRSTRYCYPSPSIIIVDGVMNLPVANYGVSEE